MTHDAPAQAYHPPRRTPAQQCAIDALPRDGTPAPVSDEMAMLLSPFAAPADPFRLILLEQRPAPDAHPSEYQRFPGRAPPGPTWWIAALTAHGLDRQGPAPASFQTPPDAQVAPYGAMPTQPHPHPTTQPHPHPITRP